MVARKKQSLMNSAMILVAATIIVKIIGMLYKIPITNTIGLEGFGYFDAAYNVYIPIYSIALAGLPVAISRMVAYYAALGRYRDIRRVHKIAYRLFFISGLLGTLILLLIAYPYSRFLVDKPKLALLIIIIAPSVFICALMSSYRGYYNGLRNMYPSAISEVIEAVVKSIVGIWLSRVVVNHAFANFEAGKAVFGQIVETKEAAIAAAAPYSAAAAIAGVTISTIFSLAYLILRHRIIGDKITKNELRASARPDKPENVAKKMFAIAIPIVLSSVVFNLTSLIDSTTVLSRLGSVIEKHPEVFNTMYAEAYKLTEIEDLSAFLFGAYAVALNFKNLLPTLTMTLGVSVIPVLTEAWALKQKSTIKRSIESVLHVTMLISLPAGVGMAVMARPILELLYSTDSVLAGLSVSVPTMVAFGLASFLIASSQPTTSMLQGIGRTDIPLYSTTIAAVVKIALNFALISIPKINIFGAVVSSITSYVIIAVINYYSLISITKVKINIYKIFIKPLFCSLLCGASAWLTYNGLSNAINHKIASLIAIAFAALVYALALLATRTITIKEISTLRKGA